MIQFFIHTISWGQPVIFLNMTLMLQPVCITIPGWAKTCSKYYVLRFLVHPKSFSQTLLTIPKNRISMIKTAQNW